MEGDSIASFAPRRWRSRLKEMFIDLHFKSIGCSRKKKRTANNDTRTSQMFGVCVKLDGQGRKIRSHVVAVTVSPDQAAEQGYVVIVQPHTHVQKGHCQYLWLSNGKNIRLKSRESKQPQEAASDYHSLKISLNNTEGPQPKLEWARKGRVCYEGQRNWSFHKINKKSEAENQESEDSESEANEDENFEQNHRRPYDKPASRFVRRMFLEKYKLKRKSKAWKLDIESLMSYSGSKAVAEGLVSTSSYLDFQDVNRSSYNFLSGRKDHLEDVSNKKRPRSTLTLADFCTTDTAARLGLVLSSHISSSGYESGDSHPLPNESNSETINDISEIADMSSEFLDTQRSIEQTEINLSDTNDNVPAKTDDSIIPDKFGNEIPIELPYNSETTAILETTRDDFVTVKLYRSDVRPDRLRTEFRLDYREAACKPRRFVINISRLVYQRIALLNRLRLGVVQKLDLSTYIVFAFNKEKGQNLDEFRVWASSTWSKSTAAYIFRDCSAGDNEVSKIQSLIREVVREAETLSVTCLMSETENLQSFMRRPVCNFVLLRYVAKWETGTVSVPYTTEWCQDYENQDVSERKISSKVLSDVNVILNGDEKDSKEPTRRGPNHSSICCSCLSDFDTDTSKTQLFPMALDVCSHWFCDSCWRSNMLAKMRKEKGFCKPICLEVGCCTLINSVTLLTFMEIKEIRRINQIRLKMYTRSMPCAFCPNPECSRLLYPKLRKNIENIGMVACCPCSFQICFGCLQAPHWPANCQEAEKYHKLIKQSQDDMLQRPLAEDEFPEVILRGKKCPRCGLFIQQKNGHKFETCGCGCEFCWPCGKEVIKNFHAHRECVERFIHSDTILKENIHKDIREMTKTTKWYRVALSHRRMRHPDVIGAMYCMSDSLALKIANVSKNGQYVGDAPKASLDWDDSLKDWAMENQKNLEMSNCASFSSLQQYSRCSSARPLSSAMSKVSFYEETSPEDLVISRAASNLVHMKVELHYIIEYTAVLLENSVTLCGKIIRCLERAEDLCTSLGILLQDPHTHNACRIIPTFLRLQTQAKQTIGNILTEVSKIKS